MLQQQLRKLAGAFKRGFYAGSMLSFMVYVFARILFYEFTFTAWEEVSNFFIIIVTGGLLVSAALLTFLLLEMGLKYLSDIRVSLFFLRLKGIDHDKVTNGSMNDMKTAA